MYSLVFWDLDGTLTDPWVGIARAVRHALRRLNLPELDDPSLRRFIGPPLLDSFARECGLDAMSARQAVAAYREYYQEQGVREQHVYPGIAELLRSLFEAGVTQVVATSKPTVFARTILQGHGLDPLFSDIVGSELDGRRASKHAVLEYARRLFPVSAGREGVMVGDTAADIAAARALGLDAIWVRYGYGDAAEALSARPTAVADTVDRLAVLLSRPRHRRDASSRGVR
jgi:phosphoglycolate phosphatase